MNQTQFARYKSLVHDWEAFLATVQRPLPNTIWVNPNKISSSAFVGLMHESGIHLKPIPWHADAFKLPENVSPGLRWEYLAGMFHVQEEVSMLPVYLLDLQPTDRVLDMCAAPGNKTAQMSVLMGNRGTIVAVDRNGGRMRAARQVFNRLGIVNVTAVTHDAGNLPKGIGRFDKVLADVPCTCEGTCRKDPDIVNRVDEASYQRLARKQKAILRKAVQLCRPGGRIVYSTCTFAPEENEMVVDAILKESHGRVRLLPVEIPGFTLAHGITEWQDQIFDSSLKLAARAWPEQNDTGGFFMALLERLPDGEVVEEAPTAVDLYPDLIQPEPWLSQTRDRFGLDTAVFAAYDILRMSKRGIWLINSDHQPAQVPKPDSIGMTFIRSKGKYPKLTTASALYFGEQATRNLVDLDAAQALAFYGRQEFPVSSDQLIDCNSSGFVMARFRGFPIGIGIYRQAKGTLESTFPKGWARPNIQID